MFHISNFKGILLLLSRTPQLHPIFHPFFLLIWSGWIVEHGRGYRSHSFCLFLSYVLYLVNHWSLGNVCWLKVNLYLQDWWEARQSLGPAKSSHWCFGCCHAGDNHTWLVAYFPRTNCPHSWLETMHSARTSVVSWTFRGSLMSHCTKTGAWVLVPNSIDAVVSWGVPC